MAKSPPETSHAAWRLPLAERANVPTDDTFSDDAQHEAVSQHAAHHAAVISALVCVAGVLLALLIALCWIKRTSIASWLRSNHLFSPAASYKLSSVENTPSSGGSEWTVLRETRPVVHAKEDAVERSESMQWTRHDLRQVSSATATAALPARKMRAGVRDFSDKYIDLDRRQISSTTATAPARAELDAVSPFKHQQETPQAVRELEATLQSYPKGYLNCSLPTMSTPGTMPGPITPATTAIRTANSSPAELATPTMPSLSSQQQRQYATPHQQTRPGPAYTPSVYHSQPPTSLPHAQTSKCEDSNAFTSPSSAQTHSTLASLPNPFVNAPTLAPLPRRGVSAAAAPPPPSLPQPYSTVSLRSTAEIYRRIDSNLDLYRELSTRVKERGSTTTANTDDPIANISPARSVATSAASPSKPEVHPKNKEPIYRGLSLPSSSSPHRTGSQRGSPSKSDGAPWDYLSAEDAVGGGWRNSGGWETIYEGDEEGEEGDAKK